jgi:hypothetical protein
VPPPPDPARLAVAELTGIAKHHAAYDPPGGVVTEAAVAELREIADARPDGAVLLAEVAGILLGAHEGALDEARARNAAGFCVAAGADPELLERWTAEGKRRRAQADLPPFGTKVLGTSN